MDDQHDQHDLVLRTIPSCPDEQQLVSLCNTYVSDHLNVVSAISQKERALTKLTEKYNLGVYPNTLKAGAELQVSNVVPEELRSQHSEIFNATKEKFHKELTANVIACRKVELESFRERLESLRPSFTMELATLLHPQWGEFLLRWGKNTPVALSDGFINHLLDTRLMNDACPPVLLYNQCIQYVDYEISLKLYNQELSKKAAKAKREAAQAAQDAGAEMELDTNVDKKVKDLIDAALTPLKLELKKLQTSKTQSAGPSKVQKNERGDGEPKKKAAFATKDESSKRLAGKGKGTGKASKRPSSTRSKRPQSKPTTPDKNKKAQN